MSGVNEALEKFDTLRKDSMFLELLKIAILFEQLKEELDTVTDVASKAYRDQNDFNTQVYIGGYRDGLLDIKDDIDKKFAIMNSTVFNIIGWPEEIRETMCDNISDLLDVLENNDVSEEIMIDAVKCSITKHFKSLNLSK